MKSKLYIILPAFNEGNSLMKLVPDITETVGRDACIIIIDDGSSDGTAGVFEKFSDRINIKLISHISNRGLGVAIGTALEYVAEHTRRQDLIIMMDADGTHDPGIIPDMIKKLDDCDIVTASRFAAGGAEIGLSFFRKILSRGARMLYRSLFPLQGTKDYTCIYRGYRSSIIIDYFTAAGELPVSSKGFPAIAEVLVNLSFFGAAICEVPLKLRYDRKIGRSKIKIVKAIIGYLFLALKLTVQSKKIKGSSTHCVGK